MKFQSSMRHLQSLTMLAAVAVTFPAAAEERVPEPLPKSRDAKTVEATAPAAAPEGTSQAPPKSRDAKTIEPKPPMVDLKIEGIRNGLQIGVQPKEEGPAHENPAASCKEDCELKLPAGSYTLTASQIEPQEAPQAEAPGADLGAQPDVTASEADAFRRRLGNALGAGGAVAAAVGTYLVITTIVARPSTHGEFLTGRTEFFYAGLAGIGVGAGLMVGGFSLAAANRAAPVAVDRVPAVAERRGLGEMGVSLTGTF